MDALSKGRERFDRHMNGTSRNVSDWFTDLGPDSEEVTVGLTGETGRLWRIPGTNRAELFVKSRQPGTFMLVLASVLLLALAVAQGYVSYRAQFVFIHSAGKGRTPSTLEALGLDAAAAIFAFLGLAKARRGKRGHVERVLNVLCAFGSGFMNVLGADLSSPRSVAVYILPPVLYAATSDRLIATVASAYGIEGRSMWGSAGRFLAGLVLYTVRLFLAPPSTATGLRRWVLNVTPLPEPPARPEPVKVAVIAAKDGPKSLTPPRTRKAINRGPGKTARFLDRVKHKHGDLGGIDVATTARIAKQLHGDLHESQARKELRAAVLAAKGEPK